MVAFGGGNGLIIRSLFDGGDTLLARGRCPVSLLLSDRVRLKRSAPERIPARAKRGLIVRGLFWDKVGEKDSLMIHKGAILAV